MEHKPLKDRLQNHGVEAEALNFRPPPGCVLERHNQAPLQGQAKPWSAHDSNRYRDQRDRHQDQSERDPKRFRHTITTVTSDK